MIKIIGGLFLFCSVSFDFLTQIACEQLMHKLITVNTADKTACVIVVCDVSRILGKNIADKLIYGIIALNLKRVIYG